MFQWILGNGLASKVGKGGPQAMSLLSTMGTGDFAMDERADMNGESKKTDGRFDELQTEIRALLEGFLDRQVTSVSAHQKTGNSYQSVMFADAVRKGFRDVRVNALAGIDVKGKTVCDLGANLGETARDLSRRGARRVDAYEYDHFYNRVASYITAYNGIPDVNHFQADVSQPGFMRHDYDITICLSAFNLVRKNLDHICGKTNDLIIIETHEISDASWRSFYVDKITPTHPHWCCFGVISNSDEFAKKRRLWLAFSKEKLNRFYTRRETDLIPGAEGVTEVDLSRSEFDYLDSIDRVLPPGNDPVTASNVRKNVERLRDLEMELTAGNPPDISMSGVAYWLALVVGISDLRREQTVTPQNTYVTWMRRGIEAGKIDPGLRPMLKTPVKFHEYASARLTALEAALRKRDIGVFRGLPTVYNASPAHPSLPRHKTLYLSESGTSVYTPWLDGHHRVFVMRILGIKKTPMMLIWDLSLLREQNSLVSLDRIRNYESRINQYLAGVAVDDPIIVPENLSTRHR